MNILQEEASLYSYNHHDAKNLVLIRAHQYATQRTCSLCGKKNLELELHCENKSWGWGLASKCLACTKQRLNSDIDLWEKKFKYTVEKLTKSGEQFAVNELGNLHRNTQSWYYKKMHESLTDLDQIQQRVMEHAKRLEECFDILKSSYDELIYVDQLNKIDDVDELKVIKLSENPFIFSTQFEIQVDKICESLEESQEDYAML
jgi:hypothetical protein